MAGIFKKLKENSKLRRTLAAWLGICLVAQMVIGSLGSMSVFADNTIYKVITVSEKEILNGVKRAVGKGPDDVPNIKSKVLPFGIDELNEDAEDKITPFLMGTSIIRQDKLGDSCSAIVAVSGEEFSGVDGETDYIADNVVFIGLNGNKKSDCVFTLQIVDAKNIVIRSMTIITYSQDSSVASPPEASSSEATPSDGSGEPATPSAATGSEANGYGFTEDRAREELGEAELDDLVQKGDVATPGEAATPDHPEEPKDAVGPRMTVPSGGFAIAYAESSAITGGKVAQINAFLADGHEELASGAIGTFHIAADYSVVDDKLPEYAYFTVDFEVNNHKGEPFGNIRGPESEAGARPVSSLGSERQREWQKIHNLLEESDEYAEAAVSGDWKMITAETNTYFYSAEAKLAVFGIQNGGTAITDLPIFFTFDNYVTPIGSSITATPGILNWEELKEAYENSAGPVHSGDAALIIGGAVTITSNAQFWWQNLAVESDSKNLGNMITGNETADEIIYKISARKDYKSDLGLLYTTSYNLRSVMSFQGFSLNIQGYGLAEDTTNKKGELYLTKNGANTAKLVGLKLPGGYNSGQVKVTPIYKDGDSSTRLITGFEVNYRLDNGTLGSSGPADMADINKDQLNIYLGIGTVLKKAKAIVEYDSVSELMPSVENHVYFDAYSIMSEEPSFDGQTDQNDGVTNHHSESALKLEAQKAFSLVKEAYTDRSYSTKAEGEYKIFEPGSTVYYKISVKNNGYTDEPFDIVDTLPGGLDPATVETLSAEVGGKALPPSEYMDESVNTERSPVTKTWKNITIRRGQEAVVKFRAVLKEKAEFADADKKISTTQTNNAKWYRSSDAERKNHLGTSDVTVYVNLNTLMSSDVNFSKNLEKSGSENAEPAVGSDVTYSLKADLTEGIRNNHWITLRDNWPDSITLKEITNIPSQAIVVIRENGRVIKQFENKKTGADSWNNLGLSGKTGITVEAKVYLKPGAGADLKLKGTILTEGETINRAQAEGGEGGGWQESESVPLYAVGASIEKKAYYIGSSQKNNITDETTGQYPVDQSVTFRHGDVVCYEMTLKNIGKDGFKATVTDDVSKLFGEDVNPIYAEAKLGETGSVFMRKSTEKAWTKLTPEKGGSEALNQPVELAKGEIITFRIYLEIPEDATVLLPENTVSAILYYPEKPEKKYTINAMASITINEDVQEASIDKEVYAVARELKQENGRVYLKGAKWNNPDLGEGTGLVQDESILTVGRGDYIFYRITIHNDSDEEPLRLYEIEDWLPEGMQFVRFYEFHGSDKKNKIPGVTAEGGDTLDLGTRAKNFQGGNWLYYKNATGGTWGKDASVAINHGSAHASMSNNKTVWRARLYDTNDIKAGLKTVPVIKPKSTIVYGMIAQVTKDFDSGTELTNTTGVVVDETAVTDDLFDKPASDLNGPVGGKSYSDDLYKITTATAEVVTTGIYTPGIGKKLVQYNAMGKWFDYSQSGKNDNFLPNYPMRWQITLSNGTNGHMTRGPIESYTLKDTFPVGLTYNDEDPDGTYIANPGGKKVKLPMPELLRTEDGQVTAVWKVEKNSSGYMVSGKAGSTIKTDVDLSVPVKGKLTVQVGSKADGDGTAKYGTYVNQADLIPAEQYGFKEACEGTVIRDEDNNPASVRAEASVDIFFGDGRTEAWKEITGAFNGIENTGTGRDSSNNLIIAGAGSEITYTLNIMNQVEKGIENLVLVDRLPAVKDNGLVNNMQRNSDFRVSFADQPDITVKIRKANGGTQPLEQGRDYTVSYADWNAKFGKGSALPSRYWEPGGAGDWAAEGAGKDTLRIEVKNGSLSGITSNDTVVVTFNATLPGPDELNLTNELIAWNTFGYAYKAVNSTNKSTITVEPAKVGVRIPTAGLSVTKKVESRFEEDKNQRFTFRLEVEDGGSGQWKSAGVMNYQVTSGGSENAVNQKTGETGEFTLSNGQTAKFTVLAGRSYRVSERDADGYYVTVKDFNGITGDSSDIDNSLLFNPAKPPGATLEKAADGKGYHCIFTNARSSFFLPETGGAGTEMFRRKGAAMMLLSLFTLAGCFRGSRFGSGKRGKQKK